MHFVIISLNRHSADLFIRGRSALAQMSCVHTQACARINTRALALAVICNASDMCSALGSKAAHTIVSCVFRLACIVFF